MSAVTLQYEPRAAFIPFHQRKERFAAMVCHRRAGKTVAAIHDLVLRALYTQKKNARYAYLGPFRSQAKEIAWTYLKDATEGIRKGPPRESDLRVTLHNNATITLYGADNPDSLRGLYFDGIIIDEYGDCRPSLWGEIILPTLMDRQGWAVFIGTMKGKNHFYKTLERAKSDPGWHYMELKASQSGLLDEYGDCKPTLWGEIVLPTLLDRKGWAVFIGTMKGKNHFYKTLERAKTEPSWFHMELKASESGLLDADDLREARAEMTEAQYRQEMECDPNAAVMGTYYSEIIANMEDEGRVGDFPHNPNELVHVSADLGFSDSTAFWFWQLDSEGPIMIDYYEADGQKLQHYFDMLHGKEYEYADIWLPHDAKAKSFQTGRSTIEQFIQQGLPCKPVPKLAVQHGIDAARLILPTVRFDRERCHGGIEALRAYRRQWNEKTQQFSNAPLHDWASNGSDAFRYFALVTDETQAKAVAVQKAKVFEPEPFTLDDLWADREDNWRDGIIRI